ncbi:tetratricopeptide repeat protein [Paludibaculum fermentans]|uniref:tetratricopeptide repeat protein n=1 Tax=Paludibaculum fermentans TaxID=1473598 RepID=UPI003EB8B512
MMSPDSNQDRSKELLERHRQGQLSPSEKIELTQRSFREEAIFDELVVDGIIDDCLADPEMRSKWLEEFPPPREQRWRGRMIWGMAAAGLAATALILYVSYPRRGADGPPAIAGQRPPSGGSTTGTRTVLSPVLGPQASTTQPILLASRLATEQGGQIVFRAETAASRMPSQSGTVTAAIEGELTVSLGSADGVGPETVLPVERDGKRIADLRVAALFRDSSRTTLMQGGPVEVGDRVRVDLATHLRALWARVDALTISRDYPGARQLAAAALKTAEGAGAPALLKEKAQERLAEAEFRAGDLAAARQRFRDILGAAGKSGSPGELHGCWEALGVICLLSGDLAEAQHTLTEAERLANAGGSREARARALNNLAVLAEMQSDRTRALQLFEEAKKVLERGTPASTAEHQAIEANLQRLRRRP